MAAPDTASLTSSAQVFTTYTLPQIRAIHKNLHVEIDEKAARLRTQVGNSYRELLGTADVIVQMRQDMSDVQNVLGRMGGLCGRTVVGGKVSGLSKFRGREDAEAEMGQAAKVKLLEACGLSVGRLLKGGAGSSGDRLVLAAKVRVLSRLLISSFGDLASETREVRVAVEAAKKHQASRQRKLSRGIDDALDKVGETSNQDDILKALCAYSLASTSGGKDVLRHFLTVRGKAMAIQFDFESHQRVKSTESVLKALDLYTKTMLDVQALVPAKLSGALAGLKKRPLLADESLQALEGLRLDIYERWCGEDIQYFTPFIRHDDLDGKQAKEMLTTWAKEAGDVLLNGLRKTLERMTEFKGIIDLRTSVLQHWIKDGGRARGFDPSIILNGLRGAINDRLLHVLDTKVSKLRLVGSEVATTLEAWHSSAAHRYRSLWDDEVLDMEISEGSGRFTGEVVNRLHGRSDAVSKAVSSYNAWYGLIDDVNEVVEQLRRQRWDNDVDEIEDEETIEVRQKVLSKDDPRKIDEQLHEKLEKAYKALDGHLSSLWEAQKDGPNNGDIARYLLRILRDIRSRLPKIESAKSFGLESVPSLHDRLAAQVLIAPIEEFESKALTRKHVTGRTLWEGEPALPTSPSPGAFKLLRNLVVAMGGAGLDLWTPAAVSILKENVSVKLSQVWLAALQNNAEEAQKPKSEPEPTEEQKEEGEKSEGEKEKGEAEEEESSEPTKSDETIEAESRKELAIQWLYDITLLQHCLGRNAGAEGSLKGLADEVFNTTSLDGEAREKMTRASQEYWKRTSLLFGLLA